MRLVADWLTHPGTQAVFDALRSHATWFVGGCVRNGLLKQPVTDIDIATDAHPETIIAQAEAAGLQAVPTGIAHGTVTVVAFGKPHEITTLRRDVETDGRHATVAYSTDIAEDAARRDLTINALYATRSGKIIDPNGEGLKDLEARRVRFIGDASQRIEEDYLRILRFFRFHAWYADPAGGMDPDGLAACAAHIEGLTRIARERITSEVLKLLAARDPAPSVAAMEQAGVLHVILPGASTRLLTILTGLETTADPVRRLAALTAEPKLCLSRADTARHELYRAEMMMPTSAGELGYRHGLDAATDILLLRAAALEHPPCPDEVQKAAKGAQAVFPVKAADLMPGLEGPALGKRLRDLEQRWIESDFSLSKQALIG